MTLRFSVVLLLLCCIALIGCKTFQGPPTASDAIPPPGYSPIFARAIAPLPSQKPKNLAIQSSRVDVTNATKVRVYLNLIDSAGTLYYGGSQAAFKNMWCKVVDSARGGKNEIKKFALHEVTEKDLEPIAIALVMDNSGSMTGGTYNHIYRTSEFEPVFEDVVRRLKNYYVMDSPPKTSASMP